MFTVDTWVTLRAVASFEFSAPSGVTGTSEAGDQFGHRVVLAPPGLSDSKTRLAVSTPNEDSFATDTGLVQVFPLDDLAAEATYEQERDTVPGDPAANEHFGEGLGFVARVAERSILVGVPDDAQNPTGMVNVIPLTGGSQRTWIPGTGRLPTTGLDRFGGAAGGEVQ